MNVAVVEPSAALLSRRAQLSNLEGRFDEALELMRVAREVSRLAADSPSTRAWYESRTGELYLHRGRLADAEHHYSRAMALTHEDPLAWLGMGEVAVARGYTAEAISWLRRAEAIVTDPEVLAILGDLHLAVGDRDAARAYYERVKAVCSVDERSERMYRSFLANFYADREWNLDNARAIALAELDRRQDVHSYETAAWVHHKQGDHRRASALIERALRLGTRDAEMLYRAGQIALAAGEPERGQARLDEAWSINPRFNPNYPRLWPLLP